MDGLNESFLNGEERDESVRGNQEKVEGLEALPEDDTGEKVEESEPWGYEVLPDGKLGAVDGLVDPEAGESKQESVDAEGKDKIVEVVMSGTQISLVGKSREELTVFFDTLEEISRNFFVSQNSEIVEKSQKLRALVSKYRENSDDFIKENPSLDFGRVFDSE
jgi:hypothetical protein